MVSSSSSRTATITSVIFELRDKAVQHRLRYNQALLDINSLPLIAVLFVTILFCLFRIYKDLVWCPNEIVLYLVIDYILALVQQIFPVRLMNFSISRSNIARRSFFDESGNLRKVRFAIAAENEIERSAQANSFDS